MATAPDKAPPGLDERLAFARGLAEISARELDRLAGITEGYSSLIEKGDRPIIGSAIAAALSNALGVPLDWLIKGDGAKPTASGVCAAIERARKRARRAC